MSQNSPSSHVLTRYFLKPLIARILLCSAVLCALLEVLALLEEASTILSRHLGIMGLLKFMSLHLPTLIVEIMPLSVMIGALFTLLQMTLSSEIAVIRAAGLSTFNIYRYLLPSAFFIGLFTICLRFWVVPPCEQALTSWWNETATIAHDHSELSPLWFRFHDSIIHIEEISNAGKTLHDILYYDLHPEDGSLKREIHIPDLIYQKDHWVMLGEAIQTITTTHENKAQIIPYEGTVPLTATPQQIINMTQEDAYYTPLEIIKILNGDAPISLPPSHYLMAIFSTLLIPLQMAVMLLVTLPITYIPPRAGLRNPIPVYVMATGLGSVILNGMISALGNAGSIPVIFAVSSGQIIAIFFSLAWILRMEEK